MDTKWIPGGEWFIGTRNQPAREEAVKLDRRLAFALRATWDFRGHLEDIEIAKASESLLEALEAEKGRSKVGLNYTTYYRNPGQSAIRWREFSAYLSEKNRNKIADGRLADPFKANRRKRTARLPGVVRGRTVLSR